MSPAAQSTQSLQLRLHTPVTPSILAGSLSHLPAATSALQQRGGVGEECTPHSREVRMAAGLCVRQTGGQGARCMMGVGVVVVSRRSNCVVVWLRDGRCRVIMVTPSIVDGSLSHLPAATSALWEGGGGWGAGGGTQEGSVEHMVECGDCRMCIES